MTSSQVPSRIAMKQPFASGSGAALTPIANTSGNTVNYIDGFPSVYGSPASAGGKYVSRGEMNAIGNLASNDLFYHKSGGLNTFDSAFASAVGGYPKGAVLDYIKDNQIVRVMSLQDNNLVDFTTVGIDNIWWTQCNVNDGVIDNTLFTASTRLTSNNSYSFLGTFSVPTNMPVSIKFTHTTSNEQQSVLHVPSRVAFSGLSMYIAEAGPTSAAPVVPAAPCFTGNNVTWNGWKNIFGSSAWYFPSSLVDESEQTAPLFNGYLQSNVWYAIICGSFQRIMKYEAASTWYIYVNDYDAEVSVTISKM